MIDKGPVPSVILLCEIEEGASDSRVVGDEPMVEVDKAEEEAYFLDFDGSWPCRDVIEFD